MTRPVDGTKEEFANYATALERENAELKAKLVWLEEQFRLSQSRRFGASSERTHPDQLQLAFNEAEVSASESAEEPKLETITYRRRKRRGDREKLLGGLPVETIEYSLPEDEQVCEACDGALHRMSTQVRRELKIIPAQFEVVEHVQHIYSCRACEEHATETPIVTAPMPAPPIPNSLASPSAIAHVINQKFTDGLPLYRQERQFARLGVAISRQTLSNWILKGSELWLTHLYDRLHDHLLTREVLQADETRVQVLKEPGRPAEAQSYMWLYRSGRDGPPIVLFEYKETRSSTHPQAFLLGYSGYLHVDGYSGYESLPNVTLVGCWSHARRKFDEALNALPSGSRSNEGPVPAQDGLAFCNKLFAIERDLKDLTADERRAEREERSIPVLNEFKAWLDQQAPQVLPKTALGQAITYCQNQWTKLTNFLQDGRLEIHNNRSEQSIKPFVIGRKNWLFANTPRGAHSSAVAYSIVETAKENGLEPFAYLTYLFEQLPNIDVSDPAALDALLPWSDTLPEACRIPVKS